MVRDSPTATRLMKDHSLEGVHLGNLGLTANLGEVPKSIEYYDQAMAISREIGDNLGEGDDWATWAMYSADRGDARKAIEYYNRALAIRREIGDRHL